MGYKDERIFYIGIKIYNSNRNSPVFNWSSKGNIALAVAIAKEEVNRKIPVERESHYSMMVRIRNDQSNKTEFEWDNRQGQIRSALETTDDFVKNKLGFDLMRGIREGMEQEANKGKI